MNALHTARPARRTHRGSTLIEAMIALTVLLVGILGTMELQILGITSNAGARDVTDAYSLAHELAAALEQLPVSDPLLTAHFDAPTPPAEFGRIMVAPETLAAVGTFREWTDADALLLPGVQTDAALIGTGGIDPFEDGVPRFKRRWQVWQMSTASASAGVKGIAVSVTYREPKLPGLREVVLFTQVSNKGLSAAFAAAYR